MDEAPGGPIAVTTFSGWVQKDVFNMRLKFCKIREAHS